MRSAYKAKNGLGGPQPRASRTTRRSSTRWTRLHLPTMEVAEVLPLPHRDEVKGPFPAPDEPSDHILLAATLRVPDSK